MRSHRDLGRPGGGTDGARDGRRVVAVVGIDRYPDWPRLQNAVNDARGARDLFLRLGFEEVTPPLFDGAASRDALLRLVTDDLARLSPDDSLVLFLAGHGHNVTRTIAGGTEVRTGYLIPADGAPVGEGGQVASWVRLDSWLSEIARLPVRHVLVILDACHSGLALGAMTRWRSANPRHDLLERLRGRRSRRVITSALEDERAMDTGPIAGHSLFTGCLIEGLSGALAGTPGGEDGIITGSELGLYIQQRVQSFPGACQTPDFGAFELDDRGELVLPTLVEPRERSRPSRQRITRPGFHIAGDSADAAAALRPAPSDAAPARPYDVPHSAGMTSAWPGTLLNGATAVALDAALLADFADGHLADGSFDGFIPPRPEPDAPLAATPVPVSIEHEPTSTAIPVYVAETAWSSRCAAVPIAHTDDDLHERGRIR